ncbi:uncharacterized protein LOC114518487 isoform X2 [Dendronephthya gigantea]|uniref:uncharacterized protein LOC114518487 isoform X2 n=1 Tax=Dendronephthya gigantea TaxID=151771 RepID=UPI00106AA615|nr:uncharacterized protein LOC114518487 isoform X2 [Dendronephthya gigantea]
MACDVCIFCTLTFFAFYVAIASQEKDFLPDQQKFEFSFVDDSQKTKNYSLVDDLDVAAKHVKKYITKSGYKVGVYHHLLTAGHLQLLRGLATFQLGAWSYGIPEANVHDGQKRTNPNNIPWLNEINAVEFSESIVAKQLQKVVADMDEGGDGTYVPYKVIGHIMRCGDSPKVHVDAAPEDDEVSMMIYLNANWRKNDYGDLYLYDDDQEILAGVVPHYGRIVVWQSSIPYLPRPPSVAFKLGQLFFHIRFTKNQTKFMNTHEKWLDNHQLYETIRNKGLFINPQKDEHKEPINARKMLVSEAKSEEGKKIFVFDGLFKRDVLDQLRSVILNYGVYYYDDSYDEESDNVQWIAAFNVDEYVQSRMWGITREIAEFVSGGHAEWFPYDVSCNLIRNADTTQIHHDCTRQENEWTFLLYLNPDWSANDYGETVFYETNDDKTEIITEVLPKYGRVVIFQGIIPHSARPPSRNFTGARLSFAVKLSVNEFTGRLKASREELRHFTGALAGLQYIKQQFLDGNIEDEEAPMEEDSEISIEDVRLREIKEKFERFDIEENDIEDVRDFFKEVRNLHLGAREEIKELLHRLL